MTLGRPRTPRRTSDLEGSSYPEAIGEDASVLHHGQSHDCEDTSVELFERDGLVSRTDADRPANVERLVPDIDDVVHSHREVGHD